MEAGQELRERPYDLQEVLKDKHKLASERIDGEDRVSKATKARELPGSLESISACFLRVCV